MILFEHAAKTYDDGTPAILDLNMAVDKGEFLFLVGPSGSGKSTFLRLLLRELKPSSGRIQVDEYELNTMKEYMLPIYRRKLGVVFQNFRLLPDRNVFENVALAMHVVGERNFKIREKVPKILEMVGLAHKMDHYPSQLSGGEQQRVAIARALVNDPEILLADEPTGNLDHATAREIMSLLVDIHKMGTTVLVVTHDLSLVKEMNQRVVRLVEGVLYEEDEMGGDRR